MGAVIMEVIVAVFVIDVIAFLMLMAAVFVEAVAEVLDVHWMDVASAVLVVALAVFLAWFCAGMPWPGFDGQPVPHAVEGREEWIDLREGTHYSQGERRTDD